MLSFYRTSFESGELGRLHRVFPFSSIAESFRLKARKAGRKSFFSPEGKVALMVLKNYTGFPDRKLVEHINGNIHYQLFCGIFIRPSFKPFNEGTRGISPLQYARLLFRKKVTCFAADAIYGTNRTRKYCSSSPSPIYTGFVRKGRKARNEQTEILWILFGVHTANAARLAARGQPEKQGKVA